MSHVYKQVGSHIISNLAKGLPVYHQRIGRSAGNDHFRLVFMCQLLNLIVIKFLGFRIKTISNGVKNFTAKIDWRPMGQMPTMSKRHAKKCVTRLKHR